jgi:copper(I)-binding protein
MKPCTLRHCVLASLLSLAAASSLAQVTVEQAWARPTVAGQQGGGGFLSMTSASGDRLIGGSTPLAERVELHSMAMKGDVMEMRQIDDIELPPGKPVELKPGGLHLMFTGLKQPLALGSKLPVTLKFERVGDMLVEFEVTSRPVAPAHGSHKP